MAHRCENLNGCQNLKTIECCGRILCGEHHKYHKDTGELHIKEFAFTKNPELKELMKKKLFEFNNKIQNTKEKLNESISNISKKACDEFFKLINDLDLAHSKSEKLLDVIRKPESEMSDTVRRDIEEFLVNVFENDTFLEKFVLEYSGEGDGHFVKIPEYVIEKKAQEIDKIEKMLEEEIRKNAAFLEEMIEKDKKLKMYETEINESLKKAEETKSNQIKALNELEKSNEGLKNDTQKTLESLQNKEKEHLELREEVKNFEEKLSNQSTKLSQLEEVRKNLLDEKQKGVRVLGC